MIRQLHVIFLIFILSSTQFVIAQSLEISNNDSIESVLRNYEGKRVTVKLDAGVEISGIVKKVTDDLTHITELTGMEFYDAVIDTDEILAVIVRTR